MNAPAEYAGGAAAGRRLRHDACEIFRCAVNESSPGRILASRLRIEGSALQGPGFRLEIGRAKVLVLSYGKASVLMARALAGLLPPGRVDGFIVMPEGDRGPRIAGLSPLIASHPVPDRGSFLAGRILTTRVGLAAKGDPVIHLVSGGGSSLLASPLRDLVTAREKARLHRLLVGSDLGIQEINIVRKHFSGVKGGRLLLRAPQANHLSLIVSDVPAGFPEAVAGGCTLPDPSGWADCLQILRESGLLGEMPAALRRRLRRRDLPQPPRPADPRFRNHRWAVLASGEDLVEAAARQARRIGYRVRVLSPPVEEASDQALDRILREWGRLRGRGTAPWCLVAGGEVRVTPRGRRGIGGRAQDLAAAAATRLGGVPGCLFLAAGSDGIDGTSPAAGAMADGRTLGRSRRAGLDPEAARRKGDTGRLFRTLGDAVVTGRTGSNLRDLYLLLGSPGAGAGVRGATGDRRR